MSDKKPSKKFHDPVRDEKMPESRVIKKKSSPFSKSAPSKTRDGWKSDGGEKKFKDRPGKKSDFTHQDRKGKFKNSESEESRPNRENNSREFFKEALMKDQRMKPGFVRNEDKSEKSFSDKQRDYKDKKPGGFKKGPFKPREEKDFGEKKPDGFKKGPFKSREERSYKDNKAEGFKKGPFKPREDKEFGEKKPDRFKKGPFKSREERSYKDNKSEGFKKGPFKPREEKDFKERNQEGFKKGPFKSREERSFNDNKSEGFKKGPFKSREDKESKRRTFTKGEKRFDRENFGDKKDRKSHTKNSDKRSGKAELTDGAVRLNRFIANSGVCSRRDADELIKSGRIEVNGTVVTEMGFKVSEKDVVKFAGKRLFNIKPVYIIMNKPKDCICTAEDPEGRRTVLDILAEEVEERVFPVGRLDRNTTGVLLITNDGELTQKLTHPSSNLSKVYAAVLDKPLENEHLEQLLLGIELEDGPMRADDIAFSDTGDKRKIGIEIHSGRNRIIHRMFEHLEYKVERLDRVLFAGMDKRGLKRGEWRYLNEKEITSLKRLK